jgi:uncharacterized protein YcbX
MHLSAISIYPVKGCRATALSAARAGRHGLAGDREWMVVRPDGWFLTQRTHPQLARIVPRLTASGLVLSHAAEPELRVETSAATAPLAVTVWGRQAIARDAGAAAAAWLERVLGVAARLVTVGPETHMLADREYVGARDVPVAFADGYPVLVCNEASLAVLVARMGAALPMDRFRPNLVIAGAEPFAEDRMRGLRVGGIELRLVKPCARCIVPSLDQLSGVRSTDPTPALKAFRYDRALRGVTFGVNATLEAAPGAALAVGDPVTPIE